MLEEILISSVSVSLANIITCPLDTLKVRIQLQKNTNYGIYSMAKYIIKNEGFFSLYSGIYPSILRGLTFGGLRIGLYSPIKTAIYADSKINIYGKIISSSLSGGISSIITSPIELIKTKMQKDKLYTSAYNLTKDIIKNEGIFSLWKGSQASTYRSILLTASQCTIYDETKTILKNNNIFSEGFKLHISSSLISGLVTTTITNPIDVIKTYLYTNKNIKNISECIRILHSQNGMKVFLRGWWTTYLRLGPQTTIVFVCNEYLRKLFYIPSL